MLIDVILDTEVCEAKDGWDGECGGDAVRGVGGSGDAAEGIDDDDDDDDEEEGEGRLTSAMLARANDAVLIVSIGFPIDLPLCSPEIFPPSRSFNLCTASPTMPGDLSLSNLTIVDHVNPFPPEYVKLSSIGK